MTDTERLNLIEHYDWVVAQALGVWVVMNDNIKAQGKTLREAVDAALKAQFKWSVGK